MNPQFPVYVASKGRADICMTMRALEAMRMPYKVIVEQQEHEAYAAALGADRLLVLDPAYQQCYETFDPAGDEAGKSRGPGPARNFAWDHSLAAGAQFHWIMDDNIRRFYRLNRNAKVPCGDGTIFRCMEDFVLRYRNIALAGPQYETFAPRKKKWSPITFNQRIYSCILIRNDIPFRWRGRYNEDTDLSLCALKAGWCTVEFWAFLQQKLATQTLKGGNTKEFYEKEGTLPKSQLLARMHPDVARVTRKYGRWHHWVDYSRFQSNKLLRKPDVVIPQGVNDYGMRLEPRHASI